MLWPYLHVNSAAELPPGDYDVLHVTERYPLGILMQASVENYGHICPGEFLSSFLFFFPLFAYFFYFIFYFIYLDVK